MKKIFVPLALSLALGTAACGKSDEATNTGAGSDVVLNDEDAIAGGNDADLSTAPLGNASATDPGNTSADAALAPADASSANSSLSNGY
jgi:hypothetical protein